MNHHQVHHRLKLMSLLATLGIGLWTTPMQAIATATTTTPHWGNWGVTRITYSYQGKSPYYRQVWRKAAQQWNRTGTVKLTAVKNPQKADVVVKNHLVRTTRNQQYSGYTEYRYRKQSTAKHKIVSAKAMVNHPVLKTYRYTQKQRVNVAVHELGHALGLGHSQSTDSVMHAANRHATISHQDRLALKRAYRQCR